MRETWVRIIVAASGVLAVLLALAFAWLQNPGAAGQRVGAAAVEMSALALTGRKIYQAEGCPLCHAIAGEGNPRYPLDGVGDRLEALELRDWILATGAVATLLPRRAAIMKEDYRDLGADEIDALVAYLSGLRASDGGATP
ncbi:MAG: c-type cytochrome [Rhodocyclaceae bacterium]|jgi:cbb3-type cytochrome oxidase cytochrome c subunit|nr:c-type cytochrome [Rhodocyclaceae bacterium]